MFYSVIHLCIFSLILSYIKKNPIIIIIFTLLLLF